MGIFSGISVWLGWIRTPMFNFWKSVSRHFIIEVWIWDDFIRWSSVCASQTLILKIIPFFCWVLKLEYCCSIITISTDTNYNSFPPLNKTYEQNQNVKINSMFLYSGSSYVYLKVCKIIAEHCLYNWIVSNRFGQTNKTTLFNIWRIIFCIFSI